MSVFGWIAVGASALVALGATGFSLWLIYVLGGAFRR